MANTHKKTKLTCGVDENTPSKSEYFSWLNNTNEGSTEEQTLINLEFFKYMLDTYGMKLDIYAWDAGNLDGSCGQYKNGETDRTAQFPHGYKTVAEAAAKIGARMGVWGGTDGYGNTEEDAQNRRNVLVNLCKNYHWALFKFDTVCGGLRPEKRGEFAKTMIECRKYSPDLILLNHRDNLGEAEIYASTFLWNGIETYVDVLSYNDITAPHHRAFIFHRGHTPDMKRLTEDHGVCFNSAPDYFEDDLVYQAFNRSLILAPEIYGNPWFLRDDEYPLLARIFNYHRRYGDILTKAKLPEVDDIGDGEYGNFPVFRGDDYRRFFVSGNSLWKAKKVKITLDYESTGLKKCKKVSVTRRFPTETHVGVFDYGDTVELTLPPFRAVLFEIFDADKADDVLIGCEYEVLNEKDGKINKVKILRANGKIETLNPATGKTSCVSGDVAIDETLKDPVYLCGLNKTQVPENSEELFESAYFALDNDSLEKRAIRRSGKTEIPSVKKAREAFFNQDSYRLRGIESDIPFKGTDDVMFDVKSKSYKMYGTGFRVEGGCLRIDLGETFDIDRFEIEYFDSNGLETETFFPQQPEDNAETSTDFSTWTKSPLKQTIIAGEKKQEYFAFYKDVKETVTGLKKRAVYATSSPVRYIRIPNPLSCIYSVKFFKGNDEIKPKNPKLNNLYPSYAKKTTKNCMTAVVKITEEILKGRKDAYLAVACNGKTGNENVCVCAKIDGKVVAFPMRAPDYPSNAWESPIYPATGNYTFYLPIKKEYLNKQIEITALFADEEVPTDVYLCDGKTKRDGIIVDL